MEVLERIAAQDYGLLTNIGMPLFAAFGSCQAIAREKMALFSRIPPEVGPAHEPPLPEPAAQLRCAIHQMGGGGQALALTPRGLVADGQLLELAALPPEGVAGRLLERAVQPFGGQSSFPCGGPLDRLKRCASDG